MILSIPEERRDNDVERVVVIDDRTPERVADEGLAFWLSLDTHPEPKSYSASLLRKTCHAPERH